MTQMLLVGLAVFGTALVLLMHVFQRRSLGMPPLPEPALYPAVSLLKPLKGADAGLEANLETFFLLDYPEYQVVFGVQDESDPALDVARRVAVRHPEVPCAVVVDDRVVGFNPKVNNLANMLPVARHDLLLISDSNVAVGPNYLRHLVPHLLDPGVGMVTSLIRGVGGRGLGGVLEMIQLNTFIMAGVASVNRLGRVCAVGKSMLLRRCDLARIGGMEELGRYLAEDQVCGEAIHGLGHRVVVSPDPVDNVLGPLTVRQFASRHLRWARIRRHIAPFAYTAEVLANPILPAVLNLVLFPGLDSAALAVGVLGVMSGVALFSERRLDVHRNPLVYPWFEAVRGLLLGVLWPVPFVSRSVAWRGNRFRIGRKTILHPTGGSDRLAA
jgi:ceramide glucosyltransferase